MKASLKDQLKELGFFKAKAGHRVEQLTKHFNKQKKERRCGNVILRKRSLSWKP